jgi:hypothetical protein
MLVNRAERIEIPIVEYQNIPGLRLKRGGRTAFIS